LTICVICVDGHTLQHIDRRPTGTLENCKIRRTPMEKIIGRVSYWLGIEALKKEQKGG
jgi:hypothetical protein